MERRCEAAQPGVLKAMSRSRQRHPKSDEVVNRDLLIGLKAVFYANTFPFYLG